MKSWIKKIVNVMGYEIRRRVNGWEYLEKGKYQLTARTLIDVGVYHGTSAFYNSCPDAYLILVEPLLECESKMKDILKKHSGHYIMKAAGKEKGVAKMNIPIGLSGSSFFQRTQLSAHDKQTVEQREIEIEPLDLIINVDEVLKPIGLKVDTEGADLDVLQGAEQILKECSFVVVETSIRRKYIDSYRFSELVRFMEDRNFYIGTFLQASPKQEDGIVRGADILFFNKDFRPEVSS